MAAPLGGLTTEVTKALKYLRAARREMVAAQDHNHYSASNMHAVSHIDRAIKFAEEERDNLRDLAKES